MNTSLRRLAALTLAALATLTACAGPAAPKATEFDRQFIDMMVPHHQSAVEMAKLALTRTSRPELRTFAQSVISAQEGEIAQLRAWRKEWTGSDQTPGMDRMPMLPGMNAMGMGHGGMTTMDMTKDVATLRTAEPFDRAFIDLMRDHHRMAIEAGRLAQAQAGRAELRDLGARIVADQQREVDQLTEWRRAWYGAP